jgi:hypothetical protein
VKSALIKYTVILCIIITAFIAGYIRGSRIENVVYQQDIKPPEYTIIKPVDPANLQDLIARANSPIVIDRTFDKIDLTIVASDGYKKTKVFDRLIFQPNQHLIFAGVGAGKDLSLIYTAGYFRNVLSESMYIGMYTSFSTVSFNSFNVLCGYSF